jgi:ABC-type sugar transport system ATPase subunit
LARLLATKPPLFLMDEPLSNLDARLRMDMRAELKRLHRDAGVATAYVTHDQGEAMTMADLVVVMKAGRIEQASAPRTLYRQPATVDVAEFIGMPRMNVITGSVKDAQLNVADISMTMPGIAASGEVLVAARPEDVLLHEHAQFGNMPFEIDAVFPSGPETLVLLRRGEHRIYARADHRRDYTVGQAIHVSLAQDGINLFDPLNRKLISPIA